MTIYYEIFRFKTDIEWSVRKQYMNRRITTGTFKTIKDAENYIRSIHEKTPHRYWIDHVISGHSGHLMTLDDWKQSCEDTLFIDYDGYGDLATEDYKLLGETTRPSDHMRKKREYPAEAKYILWYNR